jgi:hypothetical protein
MRKITGLVCAMLLLASCGRSYSLDCGPLDHAACEERATEIVSVISRNFPGRTVRSIVIENAAGHAQVVLDDGRVVGFGERLAVAN